MQKLYVGVLWVHMHVWTCADGIVMDSDDHIYRAVTTG